MDALRFGVVGNPEISFVPIILSRGRSLKSILLLSKVGKIVSIAKHLQPRDMYGLPKSSYDDNPDSLKPMPVAPYPFPA